MATVVLPDELQHLVGSVSIEVSALTYRDLLSELTSRYPALSEQVLKEMALAIDDEIVANPMMESFQADSELFFFHFVKGG